MIGRRVCFGCSQNFHNASAVSLRENIGIIAVSLRQNLGINTVSLASDFVTGSEAFFVLICVGGQNGRNAG